MGYLANQNMLRADDEITSIDYDEDVETVVVRTERRTDYEAKLKKKTLTSGCAQGTAFGDVMERFETVRLAEGAVVRTSWIYALSRKINTQPSIYLEAGAIHGCVLCESDRPLLYMEDVGRHNAVDKIAGYMRLNDGGARGQDLLHHRTADQRDGHQVRLDRRPHPDLALGLHRLGGGAGPPGGADDDRPGQRQAVHRRLGVRGHRLRRRSGGGGGEDRAVQRKASPAEDAL